MSETFTKLSSRLLFSSLWDQCHTHRIVWVTMLSMADRNGYVGASIPGLAHVARVTLAECIAALETFLAPDEFSRTPDHDGRRIEKADGGWVLLNHAKYRETRDDETTRERQRDWVRGKRASARQQEKTDVGTVREAREFVDGNVDACRRVSTQADADADTEVEAERALDHSHSSSAHAPPPKSRGRKMVEALTVVLPDWLPLPVWQSWCEHRVAIKKPMTTQAARLTLGQLERFRALGHAPEKVIAKSIMSGWQGLFELKPGDDGFPPPRAAAPPARRMMPKD